MKQEQRTKMSKKKFRIGELARELQVKKFVIRFWEKEFELKSDRSQGGQRYYTQDDFTAFNTIKNLLYEKGFTIAGAKVQLDQILQADYQGGYQGSKTTTLATGKAIADKQPVKKAAVKEVIAATNATVSDNLPQAAPLISQEFLQKMGLLKQKLLQLKKELS